MIRNLISSALIFLIVFAPYSVFAAASNPACSALNANNYQGCCLLSSGGDAAQCIAFAATLKATQAGLNTGAAQPVLQGATLLNNLGNAANTQVTANYTPQVAVDFASNSKSGFGGLTFKGVGGALLQCSGIGDFFAGLIGKVTGAIGASLKSTGSALLAATERIPVYGAAVTFVKGIFGGNTKPGDSVDKPINTKAVSDDPLVKKATCLDGIAYVLSQQVLAQITNRTIAWANRGFNGNPLYVKNIDSYLLSLRNQKTEAFLITAQNSDPVFGNALRSIITLQVTGKADGLLNRSLNTPQSQAYNSFMGDFTSGGWDALLNPAYNPIGALFNATDNLNQGIASSQQNSQTELQQGNGFLGMKTCVQPAPVPSADTLAAIKKGLSTALPQTCLRYETVTPGSIIQQQVSTVTNSPVHQAELATQFNQAVGSFFDSLLSQLFNRGLSGINGQAGPQDTGGLSFGGDGSNTVTDTNGNTLPGVNDGQPSINDIAALASTVDISRPQLLRGILKTQYDYVNRASDSDAIMERLLPELGKLDYCLPGPNPTWQSSLADNFTAYVTNAKSISASQQSTLSSIGLSLYDKFTANNVPIADKTLSISSNPNAGAYIQSVNAALGQDISNKFNRAALGDAYAATTVGTANQDYARGQATTAYDEVAQLPDFASNALTADQQYADAINSTQSDIQQLEAINKQVLKIVTAAKARYVAAQKAAGTPVNTQCLNAAYNTDSSAVTGAARQESGTPSPLIQQFLDASTYFYNTL